MLLQILKEFKNLKEGLKNLKEGQDETVDELKNLKEGQDDLNSKMDGLTKTVENMKLQVLIDKNPWHKLNSNSRDESLRRTMTPKLCPKGEPTCCITKVPINTRANDGNVAVKLAHILPQSTFLSVCQDLGWGLSELDTLKNLIFLASNMEKGFDHFKISLVHVRKVADGDQYSLCIHDRAFLKEKIYDGSPHAISEYVGQLFTLNHASKRALSYHHLFANAATNPDNKKQSKEFMFATPGNYPYYKNRFFYYEYGHGGSPTSLNTDYDHNFPEHSPQSPPAQAYASSVAFPAQAYVSPAQTCASSVASPAQTYASSVASSVTPPAQTYAPSSAPSVSSTVVTLEEPGEAVEAITSPVDSDCSPFKEPRSRTK
jgi:hypothetical protein